MKEALRYRSFHFDWFEVLLYLWIIVALVSLMVLIDQTSTQVKELKQKIELLEKAK